MSSSRRRTHLTVEEHLEQREALDVIRRTETMRELGHMAQQALRDYGPITGHEGLYLGMYADIETNRNIPYYQGTDRSLRLNVESVERAISRSRTLRSDEISPAKTQSSRSNEADTTRMVSDERKD